MNLIPLLSFILCVRIVGFSFILCVSLPHYSFILCERSYFTMDRHALTEQYVLQQLILKHQPFYWSKPNARQEIDFLIQDGSDIVPIEVKAEENVKAKSLRQFVRENTTEKAYRTSMSDFRKEEWMTNLPLYAVCMI
ncbi:MAG: DUF4143 domain-containing protein [Prevotella sp.]|nr:DUF4143 domain-containing protein [Prevotella sp.]